MKKLLKRIGGWIMTVVLILIPAGFTFGRDYESITLDNRTPWEYKVLIDGRMRGTLDRGEIMLLFRPSKLSAYELQLRFWTSTTFDPDALHIICLPITTNVDRIYITNKRWAFLYVTVFFKNGEKFEVKHDLAENHNLTEGL